MKVLSKKEWYDRNKKWVTNDEHCSCGTACVICPYRNNDHCRHIRYDDPPKENYIANNRYERCSRYARKLYKLELLEKLSKGK